MAFLWSALQHGHPYDILISTALLGIGIGLAFSALGNLIVGAVEPHQTGVASGMNTVMRTLGGALGGQISATFIAGHVAARPPDRDRLHRELLDGDRLPGRRRAVRTADSALREPRWRAAARVTSSRPAVLQPDTRAAAGR